MLVGCGFNLAATLSFAYLRNYNLLVLARGFQALGSSLSVVSGKPEDLMMMIFVMMPVFHHTYFPSL